MAGKESRAPRLWRDSTIELVPAVVVLWSFHGSAASEHVEQQAARIAGALLFEACVAAASVIVLLVLGYGEPKPTLLGIAILVAAVIFMPSLRCKKDDYQP